MGLNTTAADRLECRKESWWCRWGMSCWRWRAESTERCRCSRRRPSHRDAPSDASPR